MENLHLMAGCGAERNIGNLRRNSKGKRDRVAQNDFAGVWKGGDPEPTFAVELDVVRTKPQADGAIWSQTAVAAHAINFDGVAECGGIEKKPFGALRVGGQSVGIFDDRLLALFKGRFAKTIGIFRLELAFHDISRLLDQAVHPIVAHVNLVERQGAHVIGRGDHFGFDRTFPSEIQAGRGGPGAEYLHAMWRRPEIDHKKPGLPSLLEKIQPVRDQAPSGPVGDVHRNALHRAALNPQSAEASRAAPAIGREHSVQRLGDGEIFRVLDEVHAAAIHRGGAVNFAGAADLSRDEERGEDRGGHRAPHSAEGITRPHQGWIVPHADGPGTRPRAFSISAAAASETSSRQGSATTWTPIGNPPPAVPARTT